MLSSYLSSVYGPVHFLTVWQRWTLQWGDVITEIQMGLMLRGEAGRSQKKGERTSISRPARETLTNIIRAAKRGDGKKSIYCREATTQDAKIMSAFLKTETQKNKNK